MNSFFPALYRNAVRWRWGYALLASAILFTLSSFPLQQPAGVPGIDKFEHVFAYALLGLSYYSVGTGGGLRRSAACALAVWLAVALFGISDEWHQSFVPGRNADVMDVLADAAGGAVAVWLGWALQPLWRQLSAR